jgi:hypothetical protein
LTTFTALGERQVAADKPGTTRSILLVATRCTDPAQEADFNRWYDTVHVPDVLDRPHPSPFATGWTQFDT